MNPYLLCLSLAFVWPTSYAQQPSSGRLFFANSQPLFGEYSLSWAADIRACPKKLVIKDLRPYVNIPQLFELPLSHLVFDGVPCTTGSQAIHLDFSGGEGLVDSLPAGTCFNTKAARSLFSLIPFKFSNGTFGFPNPNRPFASHFVISGFSWRAPETFACTYCEYTKPFSGPVKEGFRFQHEASACVGKQVLAPIKGFTASPKDERAYFINTKCEKDGRLWARGGVVFVDHDRVRQGTTFELRVQSRGKTYSVKTTAACIDATGKRCVDWRRWPEEIVVPSRGLKGRVFITVRVSGKNVKARTFYVSNGCDRPDI